MKVVELAHLIKKYNLEVKGFDKLWYNDWCIGSYGTGGFEDDIWILIYGISTSEIFNSNEGEQAILNIIKQIDNQELSDKVNILQQVIK